MSDPHPSSDNLPPSVPPFRGGAEVPASAASSGNFSSFISAGDARTPTGQTPSGSPPRDTTATTTTTPVVAPPPAPPLESNSGDANDIVPPVTTPSHAVLPLLAEQQQPPADPSSFLSGLFRKATATLESTIETVSQNETFASAQETIADSIASFTAPNPLPSSEMSVPPNGRGTSAAATTTAPSQFAEGATVALRALRVNGSMNAAPLCMLVNEESRDLFVVTEHAIEAFAADGSKILQANLAEQLQQYQTEQENAANEANGNNYNNGDTTINIGSPHLGNNNNNRRRMSRIYSRPTDGAIKAVCATHIPEAQEVAIAHEDASIHVYSLCSGQMGRKTRGISPVASRAIVLSKTTLSKTFFYRRILLGAENGITNLMKLDLTDIAWLHPPEMCETPLGVGSTSAPVTCIESLEGTAPHSPANASVVVGYGDGTLVATKFEDPMQSTPFAAHGGAVGGVVAFFDGEVAVSIGDDEDRSLAAFIVSTGRCLVRRILPYVPTCICKITPPACEGMREQWVCTSESVFLVGGEEGQIDLFRLVALSHQRLEMRLIRRISERTRGKKRAVLQTHYCAKEGILLALSRNGDIRRWHLNEEEAGTLVTAIEKMRDAPYDAAKALKVIKNLGDEDGINTRLAVGEGVITAQTVLAAVQDDEVGLDEDGKDRVVEEFQKKQAEMQEVAEQADGELRRAKLRIARRFAKINPDDNGSNSKVTTAAKRMAAFELNTEAMKHNDTLCKVRGETVKKLSAVLLKALESARGDAAKIADTKQAAKNLLNIPLNSL